MTILSGSLLYLAYHHHQLTRTLNVNIEKSLPFVLIWRKVSAMPLDDGFTVASWGVPW